MDEATDVKSAEYTVIERIYASGVWKAGSALHLGGESDGSVDMMLLRDADSRLFIPGASIAGAGRHYLRKALATNIDEYRKGDPPAAVTALFGNLDASLLIVLDAPARENGPVLLRDGVRIDNASGTAADHTKFDLEVIPAGAAFDMSLELVVYRTLPKGVGRDELLGTFQALLDAFRDGEIHLGARTRRGLGRGRVETWDVRRLDMANRAHVAAWLRRATNAGTPLNLQAISGLRRRAERCFCIDARLRLVTSLLVRSGGEVAGGPDTSHLSERGVALLPGTSLAGALRGRCAAIARTLRDDAGEKMLNRMFGPHSDPGKQLHAGRVMTRDSALSNGSYLVQGRVAIDRFTGGALDSKLFDEAAYWPNNDPASNVSIQIEIEEPADEEAGLMLLAFKDLWLGDLALGGETGVGRGVLHGVEATISERGRELLRFAASNSRPAVTLTNEQGRARVEQLVTAFVNGSSHD